MAITKETTRIIFNVDKKLKERAQRVAEREGVTLTSYLSLALSDFASNKKRVGITDTLNEKTQKEIIQARKDFKMGKNISPAFTNAKDAVAWLNRK